MTKLEKLLKMIEGGAISRGVLNREWPDTVSILWFALQVGANDIVALKNDELDQAAVDLINYAMDDGPRPAWYPADPVDSGRAPKPNPEL